MLRKLLTLIAIISGLTAMAAPAYAGVNSVEESQVQLSSEAVAQCRIATSERMEAVKERARRDSGATRCKIKTITIVIPTVQLAADRSRE
jgi:hypothetical protein